MTYSCLFSPRSMLCAWMLMGLPGCTRREMLVVPKLDPATVAKGALGELDKDKNGAISVAEANASPGMKAAFPRFDADGNKSVTESEIADRIARLIANGGGLMSVSCRVAYGGGSLAGGTVRFVPEAFLGDAIVIAEGILDADGCASPISPSPSGLEGMQFGVYRVEVTHPTLTLPAKYNTATTLGCDISPLDRGGDSVLFELK